MPLVKAALSEVRWCSQTIVERMLAVLDSQEEKGVVKYGDKLHTLNGRPAFGVGMAEAGDFDEELADLTMYAVQAIMEDGDSPAKTAMELLDRIDAARSVIIKALRIECDARREKERQR